METATENERAAKGKSLSPSLERLRASAAAARAKLAEKRQAEREAKLAAGPEEPKEEPADETLEPTDGPDSKVDALPDLQYGGPAQNDQSPYSGPRHPDGNIYAQPSTVTPPYNPVGVAPPVLAPKPPVKFNLNIGQRCVFYQGAQKDVANGQAAIVTKTNGAGILYLTVFPYTGGMLTKRSVFNVNDPDVAKRPGVHDRNGTWDYVDEQNCSN